jgi:peptidyl-prolyl cis-trans isomerase C
MMRALPILPLLIIFLSILSLSATVSYTPSSLAATHTETESGLLYKPLRTVPSEFELNRPPGDAVISVKYTGGYVTPEGGVVEFASSKGNTVFMFKSSVVLGWQEGITHIRVGETHELVLPPALGYGASGVPGVIPGDSTLVFQVTLVGYDSVSSDVLDRLVWNIIVTCRASVFNSVYWNFELWQVAFIWFFFGVILPMSGSGKNKKGGSPADEPRRLYAIVHHILCHDLGTCTRALNQIHSGQTFAVVAQSMSVCESAAKNGYLGSYHKGKAIAPIDKVIWVSKIGTVVGPIKSDFGWHLILVSSRGLVVDDVVTPPKTIEGEKEKNN